MIIFKVGNDHWGQQYKDNLKSHGIDVTYTHITNDVTTGIAQISVAENGENQIIIVPGANNYLSKADVDEAKELIENADIIIAQLETPFEITLETFKLNKGVSSKNTINIIKIIINNQLMKIQIITELILPYPLQIKLLNAAPARTDIQEILPYCTILCVNETEASLLVGFEVEIS